MHSSLVRMTFLACLLTLSLFTACAKAGEPERWPFEPKRDTFSPSALLDLRSLNEKTAGESGFVAVEKTTGGFTLGNGKPVRFWCVGSDVAREKPYVARPRWNAAEPDLAHHARFLAKRGVNMIRLHAHINPDLNGNPNAQLTDINEKERDWIWRSVAAMKKEGIYVTISPYWANTMQAKAEWGIPATNGDAHGLLFFHPKLQAAYRIWMKKLLTVPNPYTGIPLAKEPDVAILSLQNEDSLLFWTVGAMKPAAKEMLGMQFAAWVKKKYGTLEKAFAAWDNNRLTEDNPDGMMLAFHAVWEMTQERNGGMAKRLADQTEFWSETMYRFNQETEAYLRTELGCKSLINAGNWRTADNARLLDAERWSYTANEVQAVNRYFGGIHDGENSGWSVMNGNVFTSPSILTSPGEFPLALRQTVGFPMLITESAWVMPNNYASEGPFLVSVYGSLLNIGGYYWFATGDDEWTEPKSANGYNDSQGKFLFANPDMLGGFPAAALLYRMNYVQKGIPALTETRSLSSVWNRNVPVLAEEAGFDPNRDSGTAQAKVGAGNTVPTDAFFVGAVQTKYVGDGATATVQAADLSKNINRTRGVHSLEYGADSTELPRGLLCGECAVCAGCCGVL